MNIRNVGSAVRCLISIGDQRLFVLTAAGRDVIAIKEQGRF